MNKVIVLIIGILVVSCTSKKNKKREKNVSNDSTTVTRFESRNEEKQNENYLNYYNRSIDYDKLNHDYAENIRYLDSTYGFTPYIAVFDTTVLYYVSTKKDIRTSTKMGLIDKNFKVLLPQEYDFIYNPDVISRGLMVIQQGDKLGLFDYHHNKILNPVFDMILPSEQNPNGLAIKGHKKYLINKNLTVDSLSESDNYSIADMIGNHYSLPNKQIKPVYSAYKNVMDRDNFENTKYIFCPNYLQPFDFFPQIMSFHKEDILGYENLTLIVKEKLTFDNDVNGAVVIIEKNGRTGSASGLYKKEDYFLFTYSTDNIVLSSKMLHHASEGNKGGIYGQFYHVEYPGNNIVQIKYQKDHPEYGKYSSMTDYKFFKIDNKGMINELSSSRKFAFTKYTVIDSTYFMGKYESHLGNSEVRNNTWWEAYYETTRHLSIHDLDVMRNEIFAEYGYKFKSEQWKNFFSKYPGYKPRYDNVNQFLTDIDKQNIQYILEYKKRMLGNEDTYLQKRKETRIENNAG